MIYGVIKGQKLKARAQAAADTIDYLTAKFSFLTADWEGLVKYAHFTKGTQTFSVQLTDDEVREEDHLNLSEGEWQVYLHGNEYRNGEVIKRVTTNIEKFTVEKTGVLNGDPFPEVEASIVEQLAAQISDAEDDIADHETRIAELESEQGDSVKDVKNAAGESLVDENKVAHLPADFEVIRSGQKTGQEYYQLFTAGTRLRYAGHDIEFADFNQTTGAATFYYVDDEIAATAQKGYASVNVYADKQTGVNLDTLGNIHKHANKAVLDKFGEDDGQPTYNGEPIGGGGGTVTDVKDAEGNSLVDENGIANLPDYLTEEKQGVIELWKADGILNYTFAEITQFLVHNRTLTYYRDLVVKAEISGAPNTLKLYYLSADFFSNAYKIYRDEYSTPSQRIGRRVEIYTLSEEDFTAALKTKLDGIETGAQKNVQADWNQSTSSADDFIKNKPSIPAAQIQSDWNQNDTDAKDYIKNKPTIPAAQIQSDWEQSDNTAKDYIKNKPSIPAAQVQADWNESDNTKADYIKNKPTIPDISGKEDTANKLKSVSGGGAGITSAATDTEYPSAKAVYDELQNIPSMPSGTNNGDILVWNGSAWESKPKWQMTYQPVEYIESSGTQRIDTGVIVNSATRIVVDFAFNALVNQSYLNGAYDDNKSFVWGYEYGINKFRTNIADSTTWAELKDGDTNRHTWDLQSGSQKIDNVEYAQQTISTTFSYSLTLFVRRTAISSYNYYSKQKLYSCKFYDGQTLIRDYIPVRNITTGEGGMYDLANGKFYGNNGTGSFVIGADVN